MPKVRDSAMPDQPLWDSFFQPEKILGQLGLGSRDQRIVEIGCGYGTFLIPAARLSGGEAIGFDIDQATLAELERKLPDDLRPRIRLEQRDVLADGTGLATGSVNFVMLFNILHGEDALSLVREAARILAPAGRVAIMHWYAERDTPRGPPLDWRPAPNTCAEWLRSVDLSPTDPTEVTPWHFGLTGERHS